MCFTGLPGIIFSATGWSDIMKKNIFTILFIALAIPVLSQNLAWMQNILDSAYSIPNFIQASNSGHIYVAANQYGVPGNPNANYRIEKLVAFNASGTPVWEKTDTVHTSIELESIAVSDSAVFTCDDSLVKCYSHAGALKWVQSVKGTGLLYANNGLYVAGKSYITKFDDDGFYYGPSRSASRAG